MTNLERVDPRGYKRKVVVNCWISHSQQYFTTTLVTNNHQNVLQLHFQQLLLVRVLLVADAKLADGNEAHAGPPAAVIPVRRTSAPAVPARTRRNTVDVSARCLAVDAGSLPTHRLARSLRLVL